MAWFWQKTREAPSSDADFHVLCCVNGTESLVSLSGKITIDSSPDLRMQLLKSLESPGCRTLTADVFEVSYIDTSGLAVMVEVLKAARCQHKRFLLRRLSERMRYLLETTRLLHFFEEKKDEQSSTSDLQTVSPQ